MNLRLGKDGFTCLITKYNVGCFTLLSSASMDGVAIFRSQIIWRFLRDIIYKAPHCSCNGYAFDEKMRYFLAFRTSTKHLCLGAASLARHFARAPPVVLDSLPGILYRTGTPRNLHECCRYVCSRFSLTLRLLDFHYLASFQGRSAVCALWLSMFSTSSMMLVSTCQNGRLMPMPPYRYSGTWSPRRRHVHTDSERLRK